MDAERFDRIAKTLGTSGSRRRVLGGLLGAALGGLLVRLGPEQAGATHLCRRTGAKCARSRQCCSGRCAGNHTCQPCSRASQCPAPPASAPCKQRVCTSAGKCAIQNKTAEAACTSDGNECTADVCNASGECTHPNTANGAACTTCQASTCSCQDGTCALCHPHATPCGLNGVPCCSGTCSAGGPMPDCPNGVDLCCD